jgi:hypothetical protein
MMEEDCGSRAKAVRIIEMVAPYGQAAIIEMIDLKIDHKSQTERLAPDTDQQYDVMLFRYRIFTASANGGGGGNHIFTISTGAF